MTEAWRRRLSLYFRFALYLLHEFRWPLTIFTLLVAGGGALIWAAYHQRVLTYGQACYAVFMMVFGEQMLDLPAEWYLQPIFFAVPLVWLGCIADSLVRLGYLVITRKQNLQEWQMIRASLMRQHIIVVGSGRVGYRIKRRIF